MNTKKRSLPSIGFNQNKLNVQKNNINKKRKLSTVKVQNDETQNKSPPALSHNKKMRVFEVEYKDEPLSPQQVERSFVFTDSTVLENATQTNTFMDETNSSTNLTDTKLNIAVYSNTSKDVYFPNNNNELKVNEYSRQEIHETCAAKIPTQSEHQEVHEKDSIIKSNCIEDLCDAKSQDEDNLEIEPNSNTLQGPNYSEITNINHHEKLVINTRGADFSDTFTKRSNTVSKSIDSGVDRSDLLMKYQSTGTASPGIAAKRYDTITNDCASAVINPDVATEITGSNIEGSDIAMTSDASKELRTLETSDICKRTDISKARTRNILNVIQNSNTSGSQDTVKYLETKKSTSIFQQSDMPDLFTTTDESSTLQDVAISEQLTTSKSPMGSKRANMSKRKEFVEQASTSKIARKVRNNENVSDSKILRDREGFDIIKNPAFQNLDVFNDPEPLITSGFSQRTETDASLCSSTTLQIPQNPENLSNSEFPVSRSQSSCSEHSASPDSNNLDYESVLDFLRTPTVGLSERMGSNTAQGWY